MNKEEPQTPRENRSHNKGGYYIRPMKLKRQAVEEFEARTMPIKDILAKYGIGHTTLLNWKKQVKKGKDPLTHKPRYPEELKLRIVKEIITGGFTIRESAAHYDVRRVTIEGWCSKYSYQISDLTESMPKKESKESTPQNEHIRQLERALEDANLKIIGLETMINIAEKDLKIDIRKKPGTKQSK